MTLKTTRRPADAKITKDSDQLEGPEYRQALHSSLRAAESADSQSGSQEMFRGVVKLVVLDYGDGNRLYECPFCQDTYGERQHLLKHLEVEHMLLVTTARLMAERLKETRGPHRNFAFPRWEGTTVTDSVIMEHIYSKLGENLTLTDSIEVQYIIVCGASYPFDEVCLYCCACGKELPGSPNPENLVALRSHYFSQHLDLTFVPKRCLRENYVRDWVGRRLTVDVKRFVETGGGSGPPHKRVSFSS